MNLTLIGLLLLTGVGAIGWGCERYRSDFNNRDLILGTATGTGLILLGVAPWVYDTAGTVLSLQNRVVTVSLLGNLFFILVVFYLFTALRNTQQDVAQLSRNLSVEASEGDARPDGGTQPIVIVIPAYNEAKSIGSVLESLPDQIAGYPIEPIVISDGSDDATATRAAEVGAIVTEHPINQGQGGALRTGFKLAEQQGAEVVVTMDADGQHPVDELANLVRPVLDGEADYVMGSRHRGVDRTDNGIIRRAGIRFFTWFINRLTKATITDCTNGYRAIRGSKVRALTLTEERFSAPELIIEARKQGLEIKEIPIVIEKRETGETKKPQLGYAIGLMRTILVTWIR
jgi:hypothetical protein